jgi:hypothetical protein
MADPTSNEGLDPLAGARNEEGNRGGSVRVYALGRGKRHKATRQTVLFTLVLGVLGVFLLLWGLVAIAFGSAGYRYFGGPVSLFMGLGLAVGAFLVHSQDPYFVVDDQGVACARGRFAWRDIRRVVDVVDNPSSRSLIFVLQPGTRPQPVPPVYLHSGGRTSVEAVSLTPYGLELTINHCEEEAHAALAAYGHPPVPAKREELPQFDVVPSAPEAL